MKPQQLHDAIGELPEELLAPVDALRKKKTIHWVRWAVLTAACLLILVVPFGLPQFAGMETATAKGDLAYSEQEAAPDYGAQQHSFRAKVLEVREGTILVKPLEGEGELRSADQIYASFSEVEDPPCIEVGDVVEIIYNGMLQETYPATAVGVTDIRIVE